VTGSVEEKGTIGGIKTEMGSTVTYLRIRSKYKEW
jgi:hypothetical protein